MTTSIDPPSRTQALSTDAQAQPRPSIAFFFAPFLLGIPVAFWLGPRDEWGQHFKPEFALAAGLTVAFYLTLEKWQDSMDGAEGLQFLTKWLGLLVAPFLLGVSASVAVGQAIERGLNIGIVVLGPVIAISGVLLLVHVLKDRRASQS